MKMKATLTPLLKQYFSIKKQHSDAVLFFRVGDFYETFFEDAEIASRALGIVLTSRNHGKDTKVPLAGVPVKSADSYIAKLVKAGYKVAICEQVEDPKKAKVVVKREVVEVITPGTVMRPSLIEDRKNIFICAIFPSKKKMGFAFADLTTGEFRTSELTGNEITRELSRLEPKEILLPENSTLKIPNWLTATYLPSFYYSNQRAKEFLLKHFEVASLDGYGCKGMEEGIRSAGALLAYLYDTQKQKLTHIRTLLPHNPNTYMLLDEATIRNLELIRRINGEERGTLLSVMDNTKTTMGARLLRRWVLYPLIDTEAIQQRQDKVATLVEDETARKKLRDLLSQMIDIERITGRITTGRATPKELVHLADSLGFLPSIKEAISPFPPLKDYIPKLEGFQSIKDKISSTLVDDPPTVITEGGIIKEGVSSDLDELRSIAKTGKQWIYNIEKKERQRTGIQSLKVKYNSVFGYYIEVTKPNLHLVPEDYIRKQTLVNAERFITPELKEYEEKVLGAEEKIKQIEHDLFVALREELSKDAPKLSELATAIAELDVISNFAENAVKFRYTKPEINEGEEILIKEGRHPVVENLVLEEPFIPNDTYLNTTTDQILIITGPNMAGKSTYLRQIALITIMAQTGSFVPAKTARIGVVDRVFTRIGASDDLARGVSTFLAEMTETANILHNATQRSLIILDEIGRGTSTFDGLAIAWAVVEYLNKNRKGIRPKTVFATHYHELVELEEVIPGVKNYNVAVKEWKGKIIFLRKVERGGSDESYGIYVAGLAGLPKEVVDRANEILKTLEESEFTGGVPRPVRHTPPEPELSLFSTEHPILNDIRQININEITPVEALNLLAELKKRYGL